MSTIPSHSTRRLMLRLLALDDVPEIQRLVSHKDVASMTSDGEIPQQSLRRIPPDDFELIESEMRKLLALRSKKPEGRLLTEEQVPLT